MARGKARSPAQEATATGDYRSFAEFGVDSVVETSLVEAGTRDSGINAPVGVQLRARVRVLATADNGERLVADYPYQGRHRRLAEWAADDGRPLQTELEAGYRALGGDAVVAPSAFAYRFRTTKTAF